MIYTWRVFGRQMGFLCVRLSEGTDAPFCGIYEFSVYRQWDKFIGDAARHSHQDRVKLTVFQFSISIWRRACGQKWYTENLIFGATAVFYETVTYQGQRQILHGCQGAAQFVFFFCWRNLWSGIVKHQFWFHVCSGISRKFADFGPSLDSHFWWTNEIKRQTTLPRPTTPFTINPSLYNRTKKHPWRQTSTSLRPSVFT